MSVNWLWVLVLMTFSGSVHAQENVSKLASEYSIVGSLVGDQVAADVKIGPSGGWLVWHDNATDEDGTGISARHLNSSLSGDFSVLRINEGALGYQENPKVALLNDGGAVVVWQGGLLGAQRIYARFIAPDRTFRTGDVLVNSYTNTHQSDPVITTLANGNVAIAWSSSGQDGSLSGVYARLFSPLGVAVSAEFPVNVTTPFNQRTPSVTPLTNGNFVVTWVSEVAQVVVETNSFAGDPRDYSVVSSRNIGAQINARIFSGSATPAGGPEFRVDAGSICANPSICGISDGGFVIGWSQRDPVSVTNSWDVFMRSFNASGAAQISPRRVNTHFIGDQIAPKIAAVGTQIFVIWTSAGQDGSLEGLFGQTMTEAGIEVGQELQVNTVARGRQIYPVLASDAAARFLAVWSGFIGGVGSLDLFAQRFSLGQPSSLVAPDAPVVSAVDSNALSVTWPELAGYAVAFYELYVDGGASGVFNGIQTIQTTVTNLAPGSTHTFQLLYQLTDGRRSGLSAVTTGRTWGVDANGDGLPDDWQAAQWGADPEKWRSGSEDSDGDGASNHMELLAGTDPNVAGSALKARLTATTNGMTFSWSTQPGFVYQLQSAMALGDWQAVGAPRFAHGTVDSINITAGGRSIFYRVICLR